MSPAFAWIIPLVAPATGSALIILVAFALPGFVTVLIQERTFKNAEDPTPLDRLLRVLYYSVWTYLLLAMVALVFGIDRSWIEHLYHRHEGDPAQLIWRGALVALVPPFLIAHATRLWDSSPAQAWLLGKAGINARHEQPTAWDFFFRQRRNVYVRITLAGGSRVFGFYGANSFSAYAKDGRDLYLERLYVENPVTGWFGDEVGGNRGFWVKAEDAVSVEFYDPNYGAETSADPETDSTETSAPRLGDGASGS